MAPVRSDKTLNLSSALAEGRLADFIKQEEARGVGPADEKAFNALAKRVIKTKPQEDQT